MRKGDFYDTYQISNENYVAAENIDLLVVSISVDPWNAVLFYVWRDRRSGAVSESAGGSIEGGCAAGGVCHHAENGKNGG